MFTILDCQLFSKYVPVISFDKADIDDRQKFRSIRDTLKGIMRQGSKSPHWGIPMQVAVSMLNPSGNTPKEIWSCCHPVSVENKSYAMQLALIISARGAELCCCLGAGYSENKDPNKIRTLQKQFQDAKERLLTTPPKTLDSVEKGFQRRWYFRNAWRKADRVDDFAGLKEWVEFAGAEVGNGASISTYYTPEELAKLGAQIADDVEEGVATFAPLFNYVYRDSVAPLVKAEKAETIMQPEYSLQTFATDTGFSEAIITRWITQLRRKQHLVFQGPPGTGKTFVAERLARLFVSGSEGNWEVVQFHPSYTYEDFIQGLKPEIHDGTICFDMKPGRFLEFCETAMAVHSKGPCVLIIDEFNRANLSRVFGELMYLLEYRNREVKLGTSGVPFTIPNNVYIIGTMNTADRSIALVDHALRRRFAFVHLSPQYAILQNVLQNAGLPAESLVKTLQLVNQAIDDRHYEIGTSFFLKSPEQLKTNLPEIWSGEIEPYLEEYFYDQSDKFKRFQWESLVLNELKAWA